MATFSRDDRARLYRSIAQLVSAGVPAQAMLAALDRSFRGVAASVLLRRMRAALEAGNPFSEAILKSEDLGFPRAHGILFQAAEKSGELARPLLRLADQDERHERQRREMLAKSAYPILLLHMAVVAPSVVQLMTDPFGAVLSAALFLVPIDVVLFVIYQSIATPRESPGMARLARVFPPLDALAHDRCAASFLETLHSLYEAGVPLLLAAVEASATVPHSELREQYSAASAKAVALGSSFSELVAELPLRRVEIIGTLTVAETAGTLGDALRNTAHLLEETATADQARLVRRATALLFSIAVVYAAYRILSFWGAYYGKLANIR